MYEVHVARFYLKRKAYLAAANRAGYVVKEYQQTPAIPHALEVMREAYTKLGLTGLASDAKRVYQKNFPNGTVSPDNQETTFVQTMWDFFGLDQ
jgi:outer membrane protein assembly factor BamD